SLRIGHRESIDIDLFSSSDFDGNELAEHLRKNYGADVKRHKENYASGSIGEVDFDFISHKYPSIKPIENIDGIRMMSIQDISAMKINAIVNSGQRIKDFIDMHYLLKELPLDEIIGFYCQKYPNANPGTALSSLMYHHDIDLNVPVKLMDIKLNWQDVQSSIAGSVNTYTEIQATRTSERNIEIEKKENENDIDLGLGL
ncbi:MAG: hypothetical protein EOP48_32540, partial [Sphingobacteriales bacterium]